MEKLWKLSKRNIIDAVKIYFEEAYDKRKAERYECEAVVYARKVLEEDLSELVFGVSSYVHSKMRVFKFPLFSSEELEQMGMPEYVLAFFPNDGRNKYKFLREYKKKIEDRWEAEGFPVDKERYS